MTKLKLSLVRIDKIGDLILTLPVDQLESLKNYEVQWVISQNLGEIIKTSSPPRKFFEIDPHKKFQSFFKLLSYFQEFRPDRIVVFYAPWWVGLAAWLSSASIRVTRKSQWSSWVFFNRTLRQKRSLGETHELIYNLDLVKFGLDVAGPDCKTREDLISHQFFLRMSASSSAWQKIAETYDLQAQNYFVVHPGMAGSALNWPQEKYNELIEKLSKNSTVVITGTDGDQRFLDLIIKKWTGNSRVKLTLGQLSFSELVALLKNAKQVFAPSTGVLHIAASLGVRSLGIYSPIATHHQRRWGPVGPLTRVVEPAVSCPAVLQCFGASCQYYECMGRIDVNMILGESISNL